MPDVAKNRTQNAAMVLVAEQSNVEIPDNLMQKFQTIYCRNFRPNKLRKSQSIKKLSDIYSVFGAKYIVYTLFDSVLV